MGMIMKGNAEVLVALVDVLTGELTAINQYFLHARMCSNWGYHRIAKKIYEESIEEMKHAKDLTDRILFLDGVPNLQKLGKLQIGETVQEQLESDLKLEAEAMTKLKAGIKTCLAAADHGTRELFEHILVDEEKHIDWIEAQLGIIEAIGLPNYLAQQLNGDS